MRYTVFKDLADNVHDPDGTVAVELSCLVVATSISTQEPHHRGPTVRRLRQYHRSVLRDREVSVLRWKIHVRIGHLLESVTTCP